MPLTIDNAADDRAMMWLYGPIGDMYMDGVSANDFRKELMSIPSAKPMDLHINSPGGSFFDAITMHSLLRQRKGEIAVKIDGLAASGASIISQAGTSIDMAEGSWLMIHRVQGVAMGTADDFRKAAADMEQMDGQIIAIYSKRWSGDEEALKAAVDAETWFTGEEAIAAGLADSIDASVEMAASLTGEKMALWMGILKDKLGAHHVPDSFIERFNLKRRAAAMEDGFLRLQGDLAEVAAMASATTKEEEKDACDALST